MLSHKKTIFRPHSPPPKKCDIVYERFLTLTLIPNNDILSILQKKTIDFLAYLHRTTTKNNNLFVFLLWNLSIILYGISVRKMQFK